MQTTFEAWEIQSYGPPEVLSPVLRKMPVPTQGQVLIRIRASL